MSCLVDSRSVCANSKGNPRVAHWPHNQTRSGREKGASKRSISTVYGDKCKIVLQGFEANPWLLAQPDLNSQCRNAQNHVCDGVHVLDPWLYESHFGFFAFFRCWNSRPIEMFKPSYVHLRFLQVFCYQSIKENTINTTQMFRPRVWVGLSRVAFPWSAGLSWSMALYSIWESSHEIYESTKWPMHTCLEERQLMHIEAQFTGAQ